MDQRRIALEGTFNFRDLGGYATMDGRVVKSGVLYRSDNLSKVPRRAHPQLNALGLRLLVDLRTAPERLQRPNSLPRVNSLQIEHLPISFIPELEKKWTFVQTISFLAGGGIKRYDRTFTIGCYTRLPHRAAASLARLLDLLQRPTSYPAVFHCMGGRDRTGFCAAMVLSILGVPRETIMEDYHLTGLYRGKALDQNIRAMRALSLYCVSEKSLREFMGTHREYLEAAFRTIEQEHGSVDAYLRDEVGLTPASADALRALLLC